MSHTTERTRNAPSLTIHADDMIRHTQTLLTSLSFEDQLKDFLLSQQKVMTSLRSEVDSLRVRNKTLEQEKADLVQSSNLMKRQLERIRKSLVEEVETRKAVKKERDVYQSRLAHIVSLVKEETALPTESPVRQIISRQGSLVSQSIQARNGLDTTDESLTELDFDKSEDDLMPEAASTTVVRLMAETPDASPSAPVIAHRTDTQQDGEEDSCVMSTSVMNQTMIEAPVTGERGSEGSKPDREAQEEVQSGRESTSTLASVTSVRSKCSVPDDVLTTSVESRSHDFVPKKIFSMSTCSGCEMRIFFYGSCVKCTACSAVAHPVCKARVPVPCLPASSRKHRHSNVQDVSIADFCPSVGRPRVPPILVLCFKEIERRASSGDLPYVRDDELSLGEKVKSLILSSKCAPDLTGYTVPVLCAAVKSFLRTLSEPLITRVLWQDFVNASLLSDREDRERAFYAPIAQLPEANRHSLSYLCKHLHTITKSPTIRLTPDTLSNVFGRLVVGDSGKHMNPPKARAERAAQNRVMLRLLTDIPLSFWNHALLHETPTSLSRLPRQGSSRSVRRRSSIRGGSRCFGKLDALNELTHS